MALEFTTERRAEPGRTHIGARAGVHIPHARSETQLPDFLRGCASSVF